MGESELGLVQSLCNAGLVTVPQEVPHLEDEPCFPSYIAYAVEADGRHEQTDGEPLSGFGIARTDSLAQLKAAAECLEGICARDYRPDDRERRDIGTRQPAAGRFRHAFSAMFPAGERGTADLFDATEQWPVRNALTRETSACPAQLISLSPDYLTEPQLLAERTSAGLAAGVTGTQRALSGALLEQIERDAVAAAFADPERLRPFHHIPDVIVELMTYVEDRDLRLLVFDITSDLAVPTALCLAIDDTGRGPFLSAGASAAFSVEAAMEKAVLESVQSRSVLRGFVDDITGLGITDKNSIADGLGRVAYWWSGERRAELDAYLGRAGKSSSHASEIAPLASCDALLATLAARDFEVWVADITLPAVRAAGFEVVRALVPGLHRLPYAEKNREDYSRHYGYFTSDNDLPPHPIA